MNGAAASSPVRKTGEETLDFGVAAVEGKVVVKFNKLIQWFDMDPSLAIAFAESLINNATRARDQQMSAKPIIVSDVGATAELVTPHNGYLLPPGDAEALYVPTAELGQHGVFARRFHPFGQGMQSQPLGHRQDR